MLIIDIMSTIDISKLPDTKKIIEQVAALRLRMQEPCIVKLKKDNNAKCLMKVDEEFSEFAERYPSLFRHVYNGYSLDRLAEMLCAIDKIKAGQINVETVEKEMGESLAKQYLPEELVKKAYSS